MNGTKPWWASKGVWGGAIGVLAGVATLAGVDLNAGLQAELTEIAVGVGELFGGALAIYGRLKAVSAVVWGVGK
jgi:hypothetical protein